MNNILSNASNIIAVTNAHLQTHSKVCVEENIDTTTLFEYASKLYAQLLVDTCAIGQPVPDSGIAFTYQGRLFFYKLQGQKMMVIDDLGYLIIEGATQ
ncbi:hypothetical protein RGU72_05485 [Undibacterium sp. 5I1]|uniref:hypothetical protein n=1 Tax=unclassified Undibacterium TaxID=2630295 RepID=UPI002AB5801C|nr:MULTISPECIES: hypothetical protein [unclassified Undibacterium]MDY7537706.1 hypothetical protein [Undibacterium sp. 5I1]MEB0230198.1 hypothetical protein [Undibacterium sp. 10I3]MEB0256443.1 hypothetical protein [Undibacterium sp. 5I1]